MSGGAFVGGGGGGSLQVFVTKRAVPFLRYIIHNILASLGKYFQSE